MLEKNNTREKVVSWGIFSLFHS